MYNYGILMIRSRTEARLSDNMLDLHKVRSGQLVIVTFDRVSGVKTGPSRLDLFITRRPRLSSGEEKIDWSMSAHASIPSQQWSQCAEAGRVVRVLIPGTLPFRHPMGRIEEKDFLADRLIIGRRVWLMSTETGRNVILPDPIREIAIQESFLEGPTL